jgi:hypothetical protein
VLARKDQRVPALTAGFLGGDFARRMIVKV